MALENVKTMLGIEDGLQDNVINIIYNNAESRLKVWLKQHAGLTEIPSELQFIIEELAIARFNRIGSEGAKTDSVEGKSVTFTENDFAPYLDILETYKPKQESSSGKVMFF